MSRLRKIPAKYRLPITHMSLWLMAALRLKGWEGVPASEGPVVVTAYFNQSSGIAQAGRLTFDALQKAGLAPIAHDIEPCYRQSLKTSGTFPVSEPGGVWLIHANAQECLLALLSFPVKDWASRYRIGYWAWETTRASRLWVWSLRFFHEVWVPAQFVHDAIAEACRAAGQAHLIARLRVMPHPLESLDHVRPDRARFGLSPDRFEVLCQFDVRSGAIRKNPWAALDAWLAAFPEPQDKARLSLKVQNLSDDDAARQRLEDTLMARPDIRLVNERFDTDTLYAFMASFDAFLSLHRSEGFGLSLAESMALGVAVIATGWSGNMQFMREDNSYPVPVKLIVAHDPTGTYGKYFGRPDPAQLWADPDIAAAARALRDAVEDPAGRHQKITRAHSDIRALTQSWEAEALTQLPFFASARPARTPEPAL